MRQKLHESCTEQPPVGAAPSRRFAFTVKSLEALKPEAKRYNVWDADTPGLGIAVQPSGTLVFFHLRRVRKVLTRTTFGQYPAMSIDDARGWATTLNGAVIDWKRTQPA
jgi:hypothetical protein